jgi:hypothetical protein
MMVSERETTPALYLVLRTEYLLLQHPHARFTEVILPKDYVHTYVCAESYLHTAGTTDILLILRHRLTPSIIAMTYSRAFNTSS